MTGQTRTQTTSPRWRTALRAAVLATTLAVVAGAPLAQAREWHGGGHGGGWHGGHEWHGGWGGHPYWHGGYWGPRYYAPAYGYYGYPYYAPGVTVTIP